MQRSVERSLSLMCTVFCRERGYLSYRDGQSQKEDIASGVVNSIVSKVATLVHRKDKDTNYFLTEIFRIRIYD